MTRSFRNGMLFPVISLLVIFLDQWLKNWVVATIPLGTTKAAGNPVFDFTYLQNRGAAWSLFQDQQVFFWVISIVVTVVLLIIWIKNLAKANVLFLICLGLIFGGTWGNFLDRLRLNYVVDMIQLKWFNFPIFNLADSALSLGVFCLLIWMFLDERANKK